MILKIKALDTLFFRDGKPFTMGDDSFAQGIFPPPPSMLHGALRSAYFANDMKEFQKLKNQQVDSSSSIEINGFAFLNEEIFWTDASKEVAEKIYFPTPLDLVQTDDEKNKNEAYLSNQIWNKGEGMDYVSNSPLPFILSQSEQVEGLENTILEKEQLQEYLNASTFNFSSIKSLSNLISIEHKVGNALEDATRKTDEGKLYQLNMNRFDSWGKNDDGNYSTKKLSLLLDTNFTPAGNQDFLLKLGAEGKMVAASNFNQNIDLIEPTIVATKDSYFKLYFASPVIFKENGWLPDEFDTQTLIGNWNGIDLQLVSAFVGKYIPIGGFDLKENAPKKMYKAVPAGSVYYFKLLEESTPQIILSKFHKQKLSSFGNDAGFGLAYVAQLNLDNND